MNQPKIAVLVNSLNAGGAERVASLLYARLRREGESVILVCLEKNNFFKLPDGSQPVYLSSLRGDEGPFRKMIWNLILAWRLRRLVRKNEISIVQSHIYRSNYVNVLAKLMGAGHVAHVVNAGQAGYYLREGWIGRVNLKLIGWLYGRADLIILKSEGMKRDLNTLFQLRPPIKVIHNPYPIEEIQSMAKDAVHGFAFEPGRPYVASVGRLIPLKRHETLIRAVASMSIKADIVFIGDGPERDNLARQADALHIGDRLHFIGRVENPYACLSRVQVFALCSETEGFPNVLVEALICGIPSVSADCVSGPREILAPGTDPDKRVLKGVEYADYGALVPVGDAGALSIALNALLTDKKLSLRYRNGGPVRAQAFHVNTIFGRYKEALYDGFEPKDMNRRK